MELAPTIADAVFTAMAEGKSAGVLAICETHYARAMQAAPVLLQNQPSEYERGQIKGLANQCHTHMNRLRSATCPDRSFQASEALSCACAIEISRSTGHLPSDGRSEWAFFKLRHHIIQEITNDC